VVATQEEQILDVLRAHEGMVFGFEPFQGLMTKEVAERTKLPLDTVQSTLNELANRGVVHRSSFFWYTGGALGA
jgi:DNA-binding IclR family transcriptional regulator